MGTRGSGPELARDAIGLREVVFYLYAKDRSKIEETATVFLDEDPELLGAGEPVPPLPSA